MFVSDKYDEILDKTQSGHHLIGSAWGLVALLATACFFFSAVSYLA